jgi:hypothetical protein
VQEESNRHCSCLFHPDSIRRSGHTTKDVIDTSSFLNKRCPILETKYLPCVHVFCSPFGACVVQSSQERREEERGPGEVYANAIQQGQEITAVKWSFDDKDT